MKGAPEKRKSREVLWVGLNLFCFCGVNKWPRSTTTSRAVSGTPAFYNLLFVHPDTGQSLPSQLEYFLSGAVAGSRWAHPWTSGFHCLTRCRLCISTRFRQGLAGASALSGFVCEEGGGFQSPWRAVLRDLHVRAWKITGQTVVFKRTELLSPSHEENQWVFGQSLFFCTLYHDSVWVLRVTVADTELYLYT